MFWIIIKLHSYLMHMKNTTKISFSFDMYIKTKLVSLLYVFVV